MIFKVLLIQLNLGCPICVDDIILVKKGWGDWG